MRLPAFLVNLAVFLGSTLFSVLLVLVAGELYFRLRTHADPRQSPWTVFHPQRGWALDPGEYTHFDFNELLVTKVSVDSLGTRNPPLSLAVPPGKQRISILGDSFVFAAALNEGDTFVGQLRARLGGAYEVVNLGVESYGTGQEILLAEDLHGRGFQLGDDVILSFFANDITDNVGLEFAGPGINRTRERPEFWVDSLGALRHSQPLPPVGIDPWRQTIRRKFIFPIYLKARATYLVAANPWMIDLAARFGLQVKLPRTPGIIQGFYGEGWEARWQRTSQILDYAARTTRDRFQARPSLVYIASPFQVVGSLLQVARKQSATDASYAAFLADEDRPQRLLRQWCARQGVPFIDTTPALREAAKKDSPFFLHEAHLNALGSRVVATEIQQHLELQAQR